MNNVEDNLNLLQLLKDNELGFMSSWYTISSEDSMESLAIVEGFKSFPCIKFRILNEEQVMYILNDSVYIIKGMINIVLIKCNINH